ncbi:MAG TPA: CTP synthase [Chitinophagales bacterium]|nr:CTP synthase [Chitinophagales bacterium]
MAKFIFVTGGVTSSLGKGILAASLAKLLKSRGLRVTIQKFDPYINVDPGTMNPYEHGECYVTDDGAETDLDLGHYERFLDTPTSQANNVTTGRVYLEVINRERKGDYLGKTVQVVPHITDEIKRRMLLLGQSDEFDIIITEIGGTVGDIESLPFIESIRQLKWQLPKKDYLVIHLTLVPYLSAAKELKTKPTQHSVKELQSYGIQPHILICRTEHELGNERKRKIAEFCNVDNEAVIEMRDADSIYDVPLNLLKEKLDITVLNQLGYENMPDLDLRKWKEFLRNYKNPKSSVTIGVVGKYVELKDAYISIYESFIHAGAKLHCHVNVEQIQAEKLNAGNIEETFKHLDGIFVAPGFGQRGIDGKLLAIQYARENKIPFFGVCLGMQCAVIEFARNVLHIKDANSREFNAKVQNPVIDLMEQQKLITNMGGTMRLGAYPCELKKGSKSEKAYKSILIWERHRHRYEFNNKYLETFEQAGMIATGINPDSNLVEIVEIPEHPWFVGVQFHPEYKSTILNPHPLFVGFLQASITHQIQDSNS